MRIPRVVFLSTAAALVLAVAGAGQKNNARSADSDWPMFNRDLAGTRFSPLTQINTANVGTLTRAWTYKLRPAEGKALTGQSPSEIFQHRSISSIRTSSSLNWPRVWAFTRPGSNVPNRLVQPSTMR